MPLDVLPQTVRRLVDENKENVHPGLLLDKYLTPGDMQNQQAQLRKVVEARPDAAAFEGAAKRRRMALEALQAKVWQRQAADSLALHLARATGVENGSICLHPIYGFPYLPGTGLKGLARAWAETVWAQSQPDAQSAWEWIYQVFGVGEETDWIRDEAGNRKQKPWKPAGVLRRQDDDSDAIDCAGQVVFHDAWPVELPKLQVDFATPHHKGYYERQELPGDWDTPEPAAFLSVLADVRFEFAVAPSSRCADEQLVQQAREWLDDALTVLGAGAKTNAGYGVFKPLDRPVVQPCTEDFVSSTHRLTLTTPAFLAGDPVDLRSCRLRGGSLRGQLRWWWRTMHAGYLSASELLALEQQIWGGISANQAVSSPVTVRVHSVANVQVITFDRRSIERRYQLPRPEGPRVTPGLTFLSYGMDDGKKRYFVAPGAKWEVSVLARNSGKLSAKRVHQEAKNALWLLTHFGGIGAKSRKGFGCLTLEAERRPVQEQIEEIMRNAEETRREVFPRCIFSKDNAVPGSWNSPVAGTPIEVSLGKMPAGEQGVWAALHRLGTAVRMLTATKKHDAQKKALGTPRRVMPLGDVKWPNRHASPVHFYIFTRNGNEYVVRIVAFPSPRLPDLDSSEKFLGDFVAKLKENIRELTQQPVALERPYLPDPQGLRPQTSSGLSVGQELVGELLEEKTKKGGWKAKASGIHGVIQNSQKVPGDVKPGQKVKLKVKIAVPRDAAFDYLGPAE